MTYLFKPVGHCRVDDEDDEIIIIDQAVKRLVIVTQVRPRAAARLI